MEVQTLQDLLSEKDADFQRSRTSRCIFLRESVYRKLFYRPFEIWNEGDGNIWKIFRSRQIPLSL